MTTAKLPRQPRARVPARAPARAPARGLRSASLALTLGLGLFAASAPSHATLADAPTAVRLPALAPPTMTRVETKAGTVVPVWLWPGSEWTGSPDWYPSRKASTQPATGEVVLVAYDAGDGVSAEPLIRLLRATGATVVLFDNPLVGFDNPIIAFDDPLLGKRTDTRTTAGEAPADVLHAMITWATNHARADGRRTRIHLFGVGRGADLALQVGASRAGELHSILVDDPSPKVVGAVAPKLADKLGGEFAGAIVVHGSAELGKLAQPGISLAPDSMTYEKDLSLAKLPTLASYQRDIAVIVAGRAMERCCPPDDYE